MLFELIADEVICELMGLLDSIAHLVVDCKAKFTQRPHLLSQTTGESYHEDPHCLRTFDLSLSTTPLPSHLREDDPRCSAHVVGVLAPEHGDLDGSVGELRYDFFGLTIVGCLEAFVKQFECRTNCCCGLDSFSLLYQ